jgi:hypothetical protein
LCRGRAGSDGHGRLGRHKLAANASAERNRTGEELQTHIQSEVQQMLEQATQTDQREDHQAGAQTQALPAELASRRGRLARLRAAKARLDAEAAQRQRTYDERVAASIARAITTTEQVIVAADLVQTSNDLQQLAPMLTQLTGTLTAAGISDRPEVLLADSGYWSIANLNSVPAAIPDPLELLIAPAKHAREGKPRKDGAPSASRSTGLRQAMAAKLANPDGKARYALRKQSIEPVFGQIKELRGARRLQRRSLRACTAEWHLLCGTHNLLKLWRHTTAT